MKVGIVTINSQNMGNRLQNYAVQETLKKLGFQVETINNAYCGREVTTFKHTLKICVLGRALPSLFKKRREGFYRFNRKHIQMAEGEWEYNKAPAGISDKYDYFVCGSDQVWNPSFDFITDNEYLTFAKPEQKIAYAASFGVSEMSGGQLDALCEKISDFKAISVREDAGAALVKKASGRDATVLVDPTMMLSKEEWLSIAERPKFMPDKKYILTYFLGQKLPETKQKLTELAREKDYEIIDLWDINKKKYFLATPEEFVYLIANCALMCTDSFHGSVFSILTGVPFLVQTRKDNAKNMNSRLETLLDKLKLTSRLMKEDMTEQDIFEIDYTETYGILGEERKRTEEFFKEAFRR